MVTIAAMDDQRASATRQLRLLPPAPAIIAPVEGPLIEREAELDVLAEAVSGLAAGTGRVVVVDGAAGLGKTALLEQAAAIAAQSGCRVRRAAPGPHERAFPFGVVRTLLEAPLLESSEPERAKLLDGAAVPAGAMLLEGALP